MSHIPGSNPMAGKCGCNDTPGERFTMNCCMFGAFPFCGHAWGRTKLWSLLHDKKLPLMRQKEILKRETKQLEKCKARCCFGQEKPAKDAIKCRNTWFHYDSLCHTETLYPFPSGAPVIVISCCCMPCALAQETRAVIGEYVKLSPDEDDPDPDDIVPESLTMELPPTAAEMLLMPGKYAKREALAAAAEGVVEEEEEEPAPKPRAFSFSAASIAKARPLSGMVGELSTVKEKET
tara:strand:- start:49 stop:753 length:705 start_codon:yes stop_codon:yes gene_type:complete